MIKDNFIKMINDSIDKAKEVRFSIATSGNNALSTKFIPDAMDICDDQFIIYSGDEIYVAGGEITIEDDEYMFIEDGSTVGIFTDEAAVCY